MFFAILHNQVLSLQFPLKLSIFLRALKNVLKTLAKDGTRYVEIKEEKYPILGRIGMKNFMIDISQSDIQIGEKVKIDINLVLANQNIERILR